MLLFAIELVFQKLSVHSIFYIRNQGKTHYSEAKLPLTVVLPSNFFLLVCLWIDSVIFFGTIKLSLFIRVIRQGSPSLSVSREERQLNYRSESALDFHRIKI